MRNDGGWNEIYLRGWFECVTAIDVESSYPASIEALNIDNSVMLKPELLYFII